jgi:hypothetical protein
VQRIDDECVEWQQRNGVDNGKHSAGRHTDTTRRRSNRRRSNSNRRRRKGERK